MDENIISLLEELSLRTSVSEDEGHYGASICNGLSSDYTSGSNVSSPAHEQLCQNSTEVDSELKNAVNNLFQELTPPNTTNDQQTKLTDLGYEKSKILTALLGNIDLVTDAIKKINRSVAIGKKMERIYRSYYINPNVELDLNEINHLIRSFSDLYDSENYVREVNVSRVYQAYCKKLTDIYNSRTNSMTFNGTSDDCMMH